MEQRHERRLLRGASLRPRGAGLRGFDCYSQFLWENNLLKLATGSSTKFNASPDALYKLLPLSTVRPLRFPCAVCK